MRIFNRVIVFLPCRTVYKYYNTIIPSLLSAERDNSRQLAGGNARARNSDGIIFYNTFRFRLEGV